MAGALASQGAHYSWRSLAGALSSLVSPFCTSVIVLRSSVRSSEAMPGENRTQGGHVCDQNRSGCGDEDRRQHNAAALLALSFCRLRCIDRRALCPDVSGPCLGLLLCSLRLGQVRDL